MQSVQRRLEKLSRSFPALKDIEPERLTAAALKAGERLDHVPSQEVRNIWRKN